MKTDLEKLRANTGKYEWGKVVKLHEVSPRYTILEYVPRQIGTLGLGSAPLRDKEFTAFVDGKSTNVSHTFEGALLIALAYGHLEDNEASYMAMAAAKLLNVPRD